MENFYQWLTIFSGATISLLGWLLYSSARVLEEKQLQIDEFEREDSHGKRAQRQRENQSEVAALKEHLREKEQIITDLQNAAAFAAGLQAENSELSLKNQRLEDEKNDLRNQLQAAQQRLTETAAQNQALVDRQTELAGQLAQSKLNTDDLTAENNGLRAEIAAFSSKLSESETQIDEIRAAQQRAQLTAQQLQRELAEYRKQFETGQSTLAEMTRLNQRMTAQLETLQAEIGELKQKLDERDATIHELHSEKQDLRNRNRELEDALELRQNQLIAGQSQFQEAIRQEREAADRCARMETEIADLKQRIDKDQANVREVEIAQQRISELESREKLYREQQERLQALIADMERDLEVSKSQRQALEDAHESLREAERVCQDLRDENRRLEEETLRWQERLRRQEEAQHQLKMLQRQLDQSQAGGAQGHVSEQQSAAGESSLSSAGADRFDGGIDSLEPPPRSGPQHDSLGRAARDHAAGPAVAKDRAAKQKARRILANLNWPIGFAVSAVIVLLLAGAIVSGFLGTDFSTRAKLAGAPDTSSEEYTAETPRERPASRVRGAFQTIRATAVYSERNENAALVATIERGTKLNVVDFRDGWLEIRSKHGRPPGFIREETAVRIRD